MRRRPPAVDASVPPPELECYELWCESRGRRACGDAGDQTSMREAVASFKDWDAERDRWEAEHPGRRLEWLGEGDAPWDEDVI